MRLQLTGLWAHVAAILGAMLAGMSARAAVLPENRADAMQHFYNGGGTKVDGPALLVRKSLAEKASVYGSYYADVISGASIDVVTTASPYEETRTEYGAGVDYLYRNTIMGLSVSTSDERDYTADTLGLNVSHEIFDGLTTLSMGYISGKDVVGKTGTDFKERIDRHHYKLGVSQIFTKTFVMSLDYEGILEDGYLNSPYRAARLQGLLVPERYPGTRDTYAIALRAVKGRIGDDGRLKGSLRLGYRYFWDTWDITAHTVELGYQARLTSRWAIEPHYRYYSQSAAAFYSDNFQVPMTYMARDKELSTFTSHTAGLKATYTMPKQYFGFSRMTLTLAHDFMRFMYDDFTDMRDGKAYSFDANVFQIFVSGWF